MNKRIFKKCVDGVWVAIEIKDIVKDDIFIVEGEEPLRGYYHKADSELYQAPNEFGRVVGTIKTSTVSKEDIVVPYIWEENIKKPNWIFPSMGFNTQLNNIFKPITYVNKQLNNIFKPFTDFNKQISNIFKPITDINKQTNELCSRLSNPVDFNIFKNIKETTKKNEEKKDDTENI